MCLTWSPRQRRVRWEGRQGLIQRLNGRGGKRRSNPQCWLGARARTHTVMGREERVIGIKAKRRTRMRRRLSREEERRGDALGKQTGKVRRDRR